MEGLVAVAILLMFVPFAVSLRGNGAIWKFLSLLFCSVSFGAALATTGNLAFSFMPWVVAWIFTAIALSSAATERRMQRLEAANRAANTPFEPEGVYAGIPYRVLADGSIEAIMQGAVVRFRDLDRLRAAAG